MTIFAERLIKFCTLNSDCMKQSRQADKTQNMFLINYFTLTFRNNSRVTTLVTQFTKDFIPSIISQLAQTDGVVNDTEPLIVEVCAGVGRFGTVGKGVMLILGVLPYTLH